MIGLKIYLNINPLVSQIGGHVIAQANIDRHVDLFWGAWMLACNLKNDAYRHYFFDAYVRDLVDDERLRIVAAAECFG